MVDGGGTLLRLPYVAFLVTLAWTCPSPVSAQEDWNGPRALELVSRARDVRQETVTELGLESYAADARGYVYFFMDNDGSEERNLVKTDQVALEVYWQAPNRTRQRIVGLRDEERLPTNIQYHLDHLTIVQDDFGDRIRLGDDDEVSAVVHPLAPGSESLYDFSLGDSLTIRFAGLPEPIRVYEIQVRPVDLDAPGFVGSVFVDRATAAVVRMRFTFTPSSYVDSYLDYISISLDNALWDGRYWLPYRQLVEIRRELPILDFPLGSVIRGRYEISGYRLNEALPPGLFQGRRITAVPEAVRREFPFEQDLYAQIDAEGLGPAPDLDQIREQAADLARNHYLGGNGPLRLYVPNVSSVLRYNRAEGTVLGAGFSYRPSGSFALRANGGYSFGREQSQLEVGLDGGERWPGSGLTGYLNQPRDIGPIQAASGAVNTLAALIRERDYQDLYFVSGVRAQQRIRPSGGLELTMGARWEQQRTAADVVTGSSGSGFRPVRPIPEGDLVSFDVDVTWTGSGGFEIDGALDLAGLDGTAFGVFRAGAEWSYERLEARRVRGDVRLEGGLNTADTPPQSLFLLGGRGTLPGYDFRSFVGDRYWLARGDGVVALWWPWVSGRAFAAVGGADLRDGLPEGWTGAATESARTSVGVGLDLFWDVVRLEAGRGLSSGGEWEFNIFASKRFWPIL